MRRGRQPPQRARARGRASCKAPWVSRAVQRAGRPASSACPAPCLPALARLAGSLACMLSPLLPAVDNRGAGVVRDWRILWLAGCWLLIAACMFGILFFMPLLVGSMFPGRAPVAGGHHSACSGGGTDEHSKEAKQHSALVALATAVPFIAAATGMQINARLAEKANERHRHAGVPILLAGATLAAIPLALGMVGAGLAFALLSLAAGFCWGFHGE